MRRSSSGSLSVWSSTAGGSPASSNAMSVLLSVDPPIGHGLAVDVGDVGCGQLVFAVGAAQYLLDCSTVGGVGEGQGWLVSDPAVSPSHQRDGDPVKVAPFLGESVLLPRRPVTVAAAFQYPVIDQLAEPIRQDRLRRAGVALEVRETPCPEETFTQHQKRPSVSNLIQRCGDRIAPVFCRCLHAATIQGCFSIPTCG